jgi:acylphosphatase
MGSSSAAVRASAIASSRGGAAERHGVTGFVRNRADGTVEARLVGPAPAVEAMLAELRRGPPYGRVERVELVARGAAAAESGFVIAATL